MAIGTVSSGNLREKLEAEQARVKGATADQDSINKEVLGATDIVVALAALLSKALDTVHPLRDGLGENTGLQGNVHKSVKAAANNVGDLVNDTNRSDVEKTADSLTFLAGATKEHRGQVGEVHNVVKDVVAGLEQLQEMVGQKFLDQLGALATATGNTVGRLEEVNQQMDTYVPYL